MPQVSLHTLTFRPRSSNGSNRYWVRRWRLSKTQTRRCTMPPFACARLQRRGTWMPFSSTLRQYKAAASDVTQGSGSASEPTADAEVGIDRCRSPSHGRQEVAGTAGVARGTDSYSVRPEVGGPK